jgi:hypothetical protein
LLLPLSLAVRFVADSATEVTIDTCGAVAVVVVERAFRGVYGNLVVIDAQTVALCIAIREQAPLQHLVWGEADAGHYCTGIERRLLHLGEVVFRVAVELENADLD